MGYVAANPRCEGAKYIVPMCGQISRGTGHNCPSSLIQMAVERCLDVTSDLSVYETNMNLIYDELKALGFTVVKPDGTFYIFPKALEDDAKAFCQKALQYDLALVPGDSFGCPGYFRMAYCIETEKVRRSFAALEKFVAEEYGVTKQDVYKRQVLDDMARTVRVGGAPVELTFKEYALLHLFLEHPEEVLSLIHI